MGCRVAPPRDPAFIRSPLGRQDSQESQAANQFAGRKPEAGPSRKKSYLGVSYDIFFCQTRGPRMIFFWGPRMIFFCFSYEWPSYDFCFVLFLLLTDPRSKNHTSRRGKKSYEQVSKKIIPGGARMTFFFVILGALV